MGTTPKTSSVRATSSQAEPTPRERSSDVQSEGAAPVVPDLLAALSAIGVSHSGNDPRARRVFMMVLHLIAANGTKGEESTAYLSRMWRAHVGGRGQKSWRRGVLWMALELANEPAHIWVDGTGMRRAISKWTERSDPGARALRLATARDVLSRELGDLADCVSDEDLGRAVEEWPFQRRGKWDRWDGKNAGGVRDVARALRCDAPNLRVLYGQDKKAKETREKDRKAQEERAKGSGQGS